MLEPELIRWAYRVLLDREPESEAAVQDKARNLASNSKLLEEFFSSPEFQRRKLQPLLRTMSGSEPPLHVELDVGEDGMQRLLDHIAGNWEALGRSEPHWSVITADQFRSKHIAENTELFFQTGERHVQTLSRILERNGVDIRSLNSALEYGCGLGRITRWLAPHFDTLYAVDISSAHLAGAAEHLKRQQISNVELKQIRRIEDVAELPKVDLVYSVIVLQHNPPPVIAEILRSLLGLIKPGGVGVIQLPTYCSGYRFELKRYLSSCKGSEGRLEMHVLPQSDVFRIAAAQGVEMLEVLEDDWVGSDRSHRSNTFVVRRPD